MTAMTGSTVCPPDRLAATRDGLHRVAEHVLAAARYAASGEIGLVPDEPLDLDPLAARLLAEWYQLGAQALSRFADGIPGDRPGPVVLWPEHFDVGITAAAVNYGASPGDEHVAEPYLYAGPHLRPAGDARAHVTTPARRTS